MGEEFDGIAGKTGVEINVPEGLVPFPHTTVAVDRNDGQGFVDAGPMQVGHTDGPPGEMIQARTLLSGRLPAGSTRGRKMGLGTAHVTRDGDVVVEGSTLPGGQLTEPVRVRHVDCDDTVAELTVTYLVSQVSVDEGALRMVEEVPHHECEAGCVCQLDGTTAAVVDMVNRTRGSLRRFVLQRDRDDTGVSGTGIVAEGVLFSDGRGVIRWCGQYSSITMWESLDQLIKVHGHNGATRLRWVDSDVAVQPHPDAPNFPRIGGTIRS